MRTIREILLGAAAVVGVAIVGVAAPLLPADPVRYRIAGRAPGDRLGSALAPLGDVDGDGAPDFACASLNATEEARGGRVDILGGRDGKVLRSWFGQEKGDPVGWLLAAAPDLDSDGEPELALGLSGDRVSVVSPVTGREWYALDAATAGGVYRGTYLIVDDVDGDGTRDLVCASGLVSFEALDSAGQVALRSGRGGELIWKRSGAVALGAFGYSAAVAGDHDADGLRDVVVGEPCYGWRPGDAGGPAIHVLSLRTGETLRTVRPEGDVPHFEFGAGLVALEDPEGGQFPRLAVSAPYWGPVGHPLDQGGALGWVGVYELPSFRLEREWTGSRPRGFAFLGDRLGYRLRAGGDVDGDGATDLLVGTQGVDLDYSGHGRLEIASGRTLEVLEIAEGFQERDAFFEVLSPLGDIDGDGRDELIVGTPSEDASDPEGWEAIDAGAVRVIGPTQGRGRFRRGDVNRDGRLNITDPIALWMRLVDREPLLCPAACDADADGRVDILDVRMLLEYLFEPYAPPLPPPHLRCAALSRVSGAPYPLDCADPEPCR